MIIQFGGKETHSQDLLDCLFYSACKLIHMENGKKGKGDLLQTRGYIPISRGYIPVPCGYIPPKMK